MRIPRYVITLHVGLLGLAGPLAAQGGPPMGGGMGGGMMGGGMMRDSAAAVVMPIVHTLMMNHEKLRRTVTNLPDGVRTVTESDDTTMVAPLRAHVSTTGELVAQSRDLNVPPASPVLHELLRNGALIVRTVELTPKGVTVTETSTDPAVVTLLQAHAAEVSELVAKGMAALHKR